MQLFARCGEGGTVTLAVPARGSFADVRTALLSKRPKLAACTDLVGEISQFALLLPVLLQPRPHPFPLRVLSASRSGVGSARMARPWRRQASGGKALWRCSGACVAAAAMGAPPAPSPAPPTLRCTWRRKPTRWVQLEARPGGCFLGETVVPSTPPMQMNLLQLSTTHCQTSPVARRTFRRRSQVDPNEERLAKWTRCQLSGEALAPPCVADELGHLFNKDAIVSGASFVFFLGQLLLTPFSWDGTRLS